MLGMEANGCLILDLGGQGIFSVQVVVLCLRLCEGEDQITIPGRLTLDKALSFREVVHNVDCHVPFSRQSPRLNNWVSGGNVKTSGCGRSLACFPS